MKITMARGDVKWVRFLIKTSGGEPSDLKFTNIYFTVKRGIRSSSVVFQKALSAGQIFRIGQGDYQLKIEPVDTRSLIYGNYKFDIEISYKDVVHETFVGDFVLDHEVTQHEDDGQEQSSGTVTLPYCDICDDGNEEPEPLPDEPVSFVVELTTPVTISVARDYEELDNKPTINGQELVGDIVIDGSDYELPPASQNTLGGVKIGDGLTVDENGVISVTADNSGVYRYKGKVATVAALNNIVDPENGDVYDVEESGMNYAWNADEERWDSFGGTNVASLSNYEIDIITGSASSAAAFETLMEQGNNVSLDANITVSGQIHVEEDTVLNLSGYTLSSTWDGPALLVDDCSLILTNGSIDALKGIAEITNGGEVTVSSGTYTSGDTAFVVSGEGSQLTLDNGVVNASTGIVKVENGAYVEINDGQLTAANNAAIYTGSTTQEATNDIVINGGTIMGHSTRNGYASCGIYMSNYDELRMNGGSVISTNGPGLLMRAGNAAINGGRIIADGESSGWVGDNGTKMSNSAIIYHEAANNAANSGMGLEITNGEFIGADLALEVLSTSLYPNVIVRGGSFTPNL